MKEISSPFSRDGGRRLQSLHRKVSIVSFARVCSASRDSSSYVTKGIYVMIFYLARGERFNFLSECADGCLKKNRGICSRDRTVSVDVIERRNRRS